MHENHDNQSIYKSYLKRTHRTYTILFETDPLAIPNMLINNYYERWGWMSHAAYNMKSSIVMNKIVTKEISEDKWEIIYDTYRFIFYFEYDLKDEYYDLVHVYQLKDSIDIIK